VCSLLLLLLLAEQQMRVKTHVVMQDPAIDKTKYRLPADEKYITEKTLFSDNLSPDPMETVILKQK
jgi:hypothetical protein